MSQHVITRIASALVLVGLVAGCSSPDSNAHNDKSSKAGTQVTRTPSPRPTTMSKSKLHKLLLTVHDVPTGGWKLSSNGDDDDTSTDHDSPGACVMDFGALEKDVKNSPQADEMFARDDPQAVLIEAVASTPKARTITRKIGSRLAQCPGEHTYTVSGKEQTIHIKSLNVGTYGDAMVCRSFSSESAGLEDDDAYGKWCFVAKGDFLFTIGAASTYEFDQVKDAEYSKFLRAAMSKADHIA